MATPSGLGAGGKALWIGVTGDHDLDALQQELLLEACRCKDRLDRLAPVAAAGDMAAMREERQGSLSLMRLLAALRLPDSNGRQPQRRGAARGVYGIQ